MRVRPVNTGVRRACQMLAVGGGLAMMSGFLLAVASTLAGPSVLGGRAPVSLVAAGLMAAGLLCGVTLIAVTARGRQGRPPAPVPRSGSGRASPRAPVRAPVPPPVPAQLPESDLSDEWLDALRPPSP